VGVLSEVGDVFVDVLFSTAVGVASMIVGGAVLANASLLRQARKRMPATMARVTTQLRIEKRFFLMKLIRNNLMF
jgi:hypothetical protein